MKKRLTAIILALTTFFLSSCGIIIINRGDSETTSSDDTETSFQGDTEGTKDYNVVTSVDYEERNLAALDGLEENYFDGEAVFVAVESEIGDVFDADYGIYSSYVMKRNEAIAEKFGLKMMMINDSAETIYADVIAAKKNKEIYANLILMQASSFGKYIDSDALLNLNILPGIDANDEWFDEKYTDAFTFGSKVYALSGYATDPVEACGCLFVNLDMLAGKGITVDYREIRDGSFDTETFLGWAKAVGKGSVSLFEPYSYQSSYLMLSQGGNFIDYGEGKHTLSSFNDEDGSVVKYIKDVLGFGRKTEDENGEPVYDGIDRFVGGEAAFMFGSLGAVKDLDACTFRWEILPLPAAEGGEYITPVCGNAPILTATTSDGNIDAMAYVLNAVNATSKDFIRAEFINDLVKNRMRTTHTADMVDIILDAKRVLDPAIALAEGYSNIKKGTVGALTSAVDGTKSLSSLLSSTRTKASNSLKGIK